MDAVWEFLDMGGYAFYVWWSYAIAAAMLVINVVVPLRRDRALRRRLRRNASRGTPASGDAP